MRTDRLPGQVICPVSDCRRPGCDHQDYHFPDDDCFAGCERAAINHCPCSAPKGADK